MARSGRPYRRLKFTEKLQRVDLFDQRPRFRCTRCMTQVEDRDRAGHLERCWPEVFMDRFVKVS